jgi:hypothetical protein
MMFKKIISFVVVILTICVAIVLPARGQSDNIVVTDADSSLDLSISMATTLSNYLEEILPRFVANNADTLYFTQMQELPTGLQDGLNDIVDRVILNKADLNKTFSLRYPVSMINDDEPPEIENLTVEQQGESSSIITWDTNEYATSIVKYGTKPGVYTEQTSNSIFVEQHEIAIRNLVPRQTYYYSISCTDLSGNTYQSEEFTFEQKDERFIYLPLVLRQ